MIRPDGSDICILAPLSDLDFYDSQHISVDRHLDPLTVWNRVMAHPQPFLRQAFRIRDAISARFGVRKIGGFSGRHIRDVQAGDRIDFFCVAYRDDSSLVLTDRDRHLDVMICVSTRSDRVTVTASVKTHNRFGRIYMLPVGIAHRMIVRGMLRRLKAGIGAVPA